MKPRSVDRVRSLLGGQVIFNNQQSTLDCQVRNISSTGAKLVLSGAVSLPEEFDLNIPQKGRVFRARLRWRVDETAGVEFLGGDETPQTRRDARLSESEAENAELRKRIKLLEARLVELERQPQEV